MNSDATKVPWLPFPVSSSEPQNTFQILKFAIIYMYREEEAVHLDC
jgi:hypothetical protein